MANGNFILPLNIDEMSDTKAEVVADGPAPSPCIIFFPIGLPSTITAFKTPLTPAIYEVFFTRLGVLFDISYCLRFQKIPSI